MNEIPLFRLCNVNQCWHCNHQIGTCAHKLFGKEYLLPECNVMDTFMTEVYDRPCRKFEAKPNIKMEV